MSVGEGDAVAGDGKAVLGVISCSICLDAVTDDGSRSWAKLLCGHQFHLDCIGSAFNVKGAMQCPNCRKVEKGQWLYATGNRPLPDIVMDEWVHGEDPYDLYSELSFGVHWCPFSGFARVPSSLDEGEFSASAYHDLPGHHHAVFAERTPAPSTNHHTCPYVAFVGPIHPSSAPSNGSISEGPTTFNGHLAGPSLLNEVHGSYAFPPMDVHYHHAWDHSTNFGSMASRVSPTDQPLVLRTARNGSDVPRPVAAQPPLILGHGSASRAPSSIALSMAPPYHGAAARAHRELAAQFHQPTVAHGRGPAMGTHGRRSSQAASPPAEQQSGGGFYFVSSGRTFQEAEVPPRRGHVWEREYQHQQQQQQLSLFPERDSSSSTSSLIWGHFPPSWVGSSEVGSSGYRHRQNGSQMDRI